jgi:hypothetical protein
VRPGADRRRLDPVRPASQGRVNAVAGCRCCKAREATAGLPRGRMTLGEDGVLLGPARVPVPATPDVHTAVCDATKAGDANLGELEALSEAVEPLLV